MSEESKWNCVVCRQQNGSISKKSIYAIGSCDHVVCYECSTRMRVLCEQNECAICRQLNNEVVFTRSIPKKFDQFDLSKCIYRNNYGIYFEDEESLDSYGRLLEHPCRKCKNRAPFKSLHDLSTHLRKEHELFMCKLCVDNLKVFSIERKYYTQKELDRHKRSGDPDETSHRGHPICKFCSVRYVDDDDLHVHLRREHFYCHFCDPSGLNHFYGDYNALRNHFLSDHFLCKECDCQEEKFTNAFKTEIDLQAHIAQFHSQNMSKSDLKKAKTLSLDLFINHRSGHSTNDPQNRRRKEHRSRHNNVDEMDSEPNDELASNNTNPIPAQPPRPEDFPQLGSNATNVANTTNESSTDVKVPKSNNRKQNTFSVCLNKNPRLNTKNDEEFPALPGSSSRDPKMNVSNSVTYNKLTKQKPSNSSGSKMQVVNHQISQQTKTNIIPANPSLSNALAPQTQKQIKSKPLINSKEEFPSLPIAKNKSSSRSSAQSTAKTSNNNSNSNNNNNNNNLNSNKAKNGSIKKDNTIERNNSSLSANKSTKSEINQNSSESKASHLQSPPNLEDFPALEVKVSNRLPPQKPKPVKNKNPPPGLTKLKTKSANLSLSSVAQQVISNPPADNTTQSNGFDHSNINDFCYINPIDFNERNQSLVEEVQNVLGDPSKFSLFKEASKDFRQGLTNGDQYYQNCIEIFGKNRFPTIFSELLVLLPDIKKQNELLRAQQNELKNTKGAIPKGSKILNDHNSNEFVVCSKCKQVLIVKDEKEHMSAH